MENRTWLTNYRGRVLVHASGRPDRDHPTRREFKEFYGATVPPTFDLGGVVGVTEIVDCVAKHPSRWFVGEFGFVLRNSKPLPFLACKGQLGIRDAPAALVRHYQEFLR